MRPEVLLLTVLSKQVQGTNYLLNFLPLPLTIFIKPFRAGDLMRDHTEGNQAIFPSILKASLGFLI